MFDIPAIYRLGDLLLKETAEKNDVPEAQTLAQASCLQESRWTVSQDVASDSAHVLAVTSEHPIQGFTE